MPGENPSSERKRDKNDQLFKKYPASTYDLQQNWLLVKEFICMASNFGEK
jgi:hypothetical protein